MKTTKLIWIVISSLILLSLVSAVGISTVLPVNAANASNATISAVLSGTGSTSRITVGPNPNPIGTTVSIDIRIGNTGPVWGWTLQTITWDPQVLNLTNVQEGSFLAGTAGNPTFFVGNSKVLWDNTDGLIQGGLSDALASATTSAESSGVLATLTFVVKGIGTSQISLSGANIRTSNTDSVGVNVPCNNATLVATSTAVSPSPTPTSSLSPTTNPSISPTSTPVSNHPTPTATPTGPSNSGSIPEISMLAIIPILITTLFACIGYRLKNKEPKLPQA
ncbi:MAG: cohesin domain-containing protein [Candidatus Bathyarchaeia archaeon]|jgi:hypothetical protein